MFKLGTTVIVGLMWATQLMAEEEHLGPIPDPDQVKIMDMNYRGNGCPAGSVAANVSPDAQALTLIFDQFVASSEESSTGLDVKNCKVDLKLSSPPGWKYALFCVDYRGFADLEAGTKGSTHAKVTFNNQSVMDLGALELSGPLSGDYQRENSFPLDASSWSNCNSDNLTIDTTTTVDARTIPATKTFHLASGGSRYNEVILESEIAQLVVARKVSAASCKLGRSYGFSGAKVWVNHGCRADFVATFVGGGNSPGRGVITVDSLDGEVKQHYGIAWQRCTAGKWVQANGSDSCAQTCGKIGQRPAADEFGAQCVSGEARPSSAVGAIQFTKGCWNTCAPEGNIKTEPVGNSCYKPGQKRDNDRTDRIVGCFCQ
jgi:hypothetical protein